MVYYAVRDQSWASSGQSMRRILFLLVASSAAFHCGCVSIPGRLLDFPGSYLPFGLLWPVLYFLPTIIVLLRRKKNVLGPILVNVLLGWTIVGWIVALIWALVVDE